VRGDHAGCRNHCFTPPCPEHVPREDWLNEFVPSLHSAVGWSPGDVVVVGRFTQLPFEFT
jgi:hypothetical protein